MRFRPSRRGHGKKRNECGSTDYRNGSSIFSIFTMAWAEREIDSGHIGWTSATCSIAWPFSSTYSQLSSDATLFLPTIDTIICDKQKKVNITRIPELCDQPHYIHKDTRTHSEETKTRVNTGKKLIHLIYSPKKVEQEMADALRELTFVFSFTMRRDGKWEWKEFNRCGRRAVCRSKLLLMSGEKSRIDEDVAREKMAMLLTKQFDSFFVRFPSHIWFACLLCFARDICC